MDQEKIKEIYKGKRIILKSVQGFYKGKKVDKEFISYPNVVAILPLIEKNKLILVKQYRVPIKQELWEIPAGKIEKGEKPKDCAYRELEEEAGFKAKKLERIGEFYKSPGISTVHLTLFRATGLQKTEQKISDSEFINNVEIFSLDRALKMIKNKEIMDAHTIIAIMYEVNRFKQN